MCIVLHDDQNLQGVFNSENSAQAKICLERKEVNKRRGESIKDFLKRGYKGLRRFRCDSYKMLERTQRYGMTVDKVSLIKEGHIRDLPFKVNHIFVLLDGEEICNDNVIYLNTVRGREDLYDLMKCPFMMLDSLWFYADILVIKLSEYEEHCKLSWKEEKILNIATARDERKLKDITDLNWYDGVLLVRMGDAYYSEEFLDKYFCGEFSYV